MEIFSNGMVLGDARRDNSSTFHLFTTFHFQQFILLELILHNFIIRKVWVNIFIKSIDVFTLYF